SCYCLDWRGLKDLRGARDSVRGTRAGEPRKMLLNDFIERKNLMENPETIKEIVREKYGRLARENESCCGPTSCCGPAAEGESPFVDFSDDHARLEGYVRDADMGLGCGLPTEGADL